MSTQDDESVWAQLHARHTGGVRPRPLTAFRRATETCPDDRTPVALVHVDGEQPMILIRVNDFETITNGGQR